jgi:hypothetical protein
MTDLLLKSTGPVADQYKVLAGDQVVGHIRLSESAPPTAPWRWTLAYGQTKARTRAHGYGRLAKPPCRRLPRTGAGSEQRGLIPHQNAAMTDRSCMLTIIFATTLWFIVRVGMHWYFGVW